MKTEVVFKYSDTRVKMDAIWLIYFCLVFCYYTNTYIQYFCHAFILIYSIHTRLKRKGISLTNSSIKKLFITCGSYGLLVLWAQITKIWAYDVMEDSSTFVGMVKIFIVIVCMAFCVGSKEDMESLMTAFVFATAFMSILILLTSPVATFGTTSFGGITNQFRNTIANVVFFAIIMVWYLKPRFNRPITAFLMILFFVTGCCTGSRRGIIQLVIIACLYVLTQSGLKKKFYLLSGFAIAAIIGIGLMQSVPYLNETYWARMSTMFSSSTEYDGGDEEDASTVGRNIYREIGMDMFKERPIRGYGIDGFHCYVEDHPYEYTDYEMAAVYSHCNYVELLADFGIFGFIIYYSMHIYLLINSLITFKSSRFSRLTLIIIIATLILDYGGISYQSYFAIYLYVLLILGIYYEKCEGKLERRDRLQLKET